MTGKLRFFLHQTPEVQDPISSRRIWRLQCSKIFQHLCEQMNKHVDCYHFVEYFLNWIWYFIAQAGIFTTSPGESDVQEKPSSKNVGPCTEEILTKTHLIVPRKRRRTSRLPCLVGKSSIFNIQDIFEKGPSSQRSSCSSTNQLERPIKDCTFSWISNQITHIIHPEKKDFCLLSYIIIMFCYFHPRIFPNRHLKDHLETYRL